MFSFFRKKQVTPFDNLPRKELVRRLCELDRLTSGLIEHGTPDVAKFAAKAFSIIEDTPMDIDAIHYKRSKEVCFGVETPKE